MIGCICARCKKESENSFFGHCLHCISFGKRIDKINDNIIVIGNYTWIFVENSNNRYCVINTDDFEVLFKSDFNFELELNEDDYCIYIKGTDIKFKDYLRNFFNIKTRFANEYDFRRGRF